MKRPICPRCQSPQDIPDEAIAYRCQTCQADVEIATCFKCGSPWPILRGAQQFTCSICGTLNRRLPPEPTAAPAPADPTGSLAYTGGGARPAAAVGTNGMATAALVLGLVGAIVGLIPIAFWIAFICGVLAFIFGVVGSRNARAGAPHGGMATAGLVLGAIAVILGIVGLVIVINAANEITKILNSPIPTF